MTTTCVLVRERLGAYVDGELDGAERQEVSQHLLLCAPCTEEQQAIRRVGEWLRSNVASPAVDLQGLASGVISRARAEDAQSWRAWVVTAVEDWHWALTGAGALSAALFSVLLVSAIFVSGPRVERQDSLAAMLNNLQTPVGPFFIMATPAGADQLPMLLQLDNGDGRGAAAVSSAVPVGFSGPTGVELALALSQAVVRPDGRMSEWDSMSKPDRKHAEELLDGIQRLGVVARMSISGRRLSIQKLGFVMSTSVSGKAL